MFNAALVRHEARTVGDDYAAPAAVPSVPPGGGYMTRPADVPNGSQPFAAPWAGPTIPRAEWPDRIADMVRHKTRISDLLDGSGFTPKDQRRTNYCWGFSTVHAVEIAGIVAGDVVEPLSPASVCAPMRGYRNEGYWPSAVPAWMAEHGIAPSAVWPDTAIDRREDDAEARETRRIHVPAEWTDLAEAGVPNPATFDRVMTELILGNPVSLGLDWWRHAICAIDPEHRRENGRDLFGFLAVNSHINNFYVRCLGSKAIPSDAVSLRSKAPVPIAG